MLASILIDSKQSITTIFLKKTKQKINKTKQKKPTKNLVFKYSSSLIANAIYGYMSYSIQIVSAH